MCMFEGEGERGREGERPSERELFKRGEREGRSREGCLREREITSTEKTITLINNFIARFLLIIFLQIKKMREWGGGDG